jgi:hypothetical protein
MPCNYGKLSLSEIKDENQERYGMTHFLERHFAKTAGSASAVEEIGVENLA